MVRRLLQIGTVELTSADVVDLKPPAPTAQRRLDGHNEVVATVLIELPGGEGIICGEDGEIALTHDVTLEGGQPVQPWDRYQPISVWLSDDRMLFGGLLPPGAVTAEAVHATGERTPAGVGGGTYAVILEDGKHDEPAVGYRDAAGAFVHRPMPGEYPHQPITDAEEPCPVCGAVQYEQYFTTEEWRAGRGRKGTDTFEPSPLIVCRVCGHQEHVGAIFRCGHVDSTDENEETRAPRLARVRAEQAVQRWYADKMTLMGVTFPIYAAEGWPARINGSGSRGDDLTHLTIAHAETLTDSMFVQRPRIEIRTSVDPHQPGELAIARDAFASGIEADANRPLTDGLSDAAATLWFRAARRRRVAGAHQAPVSETEITIDGARAPFLTLGQLNVHWVAVRRHHDVTVTVAAREIDPASLVIEPIADPNARLLGPEPDEP